MSSFPVLTSKNGRLLYSLIGFDLLKCMLYIKGHDKQGKKLIKAALILFFLAFAHSLVLPFPFSQFI